MAVVWFLVRGGTLENFGKILMVYGLCVFFRRLFHGFGESVCHEVVGGGWVIRRVGSVAGRGSHASAVLPKFHVHDVGAPEP